MADDVAFLKDQVQRLNAALVSYQADYPPLPSAVQGTLAGDGNLVPWLADQRLLSPLLLEYDRIIQDLDRQSGQYQQEIRDVKQKIDKLVAENSRLNHELKENIQSQIHQLDGADMKAVPVQDEQLLHNLQQQVHNAVQEKDNSVEMWQAAVTEIDRLQKLLQEEKDSHSWRVVEKQAHQVKEQYYHTVTALNSEISSLQEDVRQVRGELTNCKMTITDKDRVLDDLKQQMLWKDQETADVMMKEGFTDTQVHELKRIIDELTQKTSSYSQELTKAKQDKMAFESRVTELQKRNAELEQSELESLSQVRESVQIVENAILEKDQAEVLVHQRDEEIDKLQSNIDKLINEAGARTRKEVDNVRKQCNDSMERLMEELHVQEMDSAEKQAQLDRALREKRAVESELEKIYKEGLMQGTKDRDSYEDINRRAIIAERARDEAEMKLESTLHSLKLAQLNGQQEKSQLEGQSTQLQQRLGQLEEEVEALNQDRLKYLHDIDEIQRKLLQAQQDKDAAVRKCNKKLSLSEQDQSMRLREMEAKLQTTEDAGRQTQMEMRKLLTAQQRMSARWKEECQTITEKFEGKITECKSEVGHFKKRNEELTALLRENQSKTAEAERMINDYTHKIRRLEDRVRDTEFRASQASKQLARQAAREKQIVIDKASLQRELERSRMASPRSARNRTGDILALSDLQATNGHHNVDEAFDR